MALRNLNDRPDGLAGSIAPPLAPKIAATDLNKKLSPRLPTPTRPLNEDGRAMSRGRHTGLSTRFSRA